MPDTTPKPECSQLRIDEVVALYGFTARHWRRQAAAGRVPGARQPFGPRGHWTFDADELRKFFTLRKREGNPWRVSISAAKPGGRASSARTENTAEASKQRTERLLKDAFARGSKNWTPPPSATSRAEATPKLKLVSSRNTCPR